MVSKLIKLQARAKALYNRLQELDVIYQTGDEDIGRVVRLKTKLETERISILITLKQLLGANIPKYLSDAINHAQNRADEEDDKDIKENLKQFSNNQGWGKKFVEQIKKYKGDIINLIISVAIRFVTQMVDTNTSI